MGCFDESEGACTAATSSRDLGSSHMARYWACRCTATGSLHLAPLAERSDRAAIRVRDLHRARTQLRALLRKQPLTPTLSPQGRGEGRPPPVNAFLTINRAKIAGWSLSVVSRVKRGSTRGRQCGASLSERWSFGRRADFWRPRPAFAGGSSNDGRCHGGSGRNGAGTGFPSLGEIGNILKRGDLALAFGILTILVVLILPLPSIVLDLFLAISITLSILILMTSLFIQAPLEFSSSRPSS